MPDRALDRRSWLAVLLALGGLAVAARPAWAHDGPAPTPASIWSAWNWDPLILAGLGLAIALYLPGVVRLWRSAGVGRGVSRLQLACWAAGMSALIGALISPVDALGAALFAGHMVQHLLLVLVAAPLLVLGVPHIAFVWSLPARMRGPVGRWWSTAAPARATRRVFGGAVTVTAMHTVAMWAWHAPALYEAALWHDGWHALEHASFFMTALLFWWLVVHARQRHAGLTVLVIFVTAMQSGVLGALLSLSRDAWYLGHGATVGPWGLTLLEDQQIAGLIMWIPASVIYIGAALAVLWRWLAEPAERHALSLAARPEVSTSGIGIGTAGATRR